MQYLQSKWQQWDWDQQPLIKWTLNHLPKLAFCFLAFFTCWGFIYKLSGCGFEYHCRHIKLQLDLRNFISYRSVKNNCKIAWWLVENHQSFHRHCHSIFLSKLYQVLFSVFVVFLLILRLNANSFLVFWFCSFSKNCEQDKAGKQLQKGRTN